MAAGLTVLYLGWVVSFTAWASCLRCPGPSPVSIWQVLGGSIPYTRWWLGREDLETCFAYYSTLDVLIISAAVFLSVLGLVQLRSRKPSPLVEAGKEEP